MPVPPTGHSSSIDSTSSYGSSKSSLLAPPVDPVSSQSDIADPNPPFMPRGSESAYAVAASPSQAAYKANNSAASAGQKFKRAFGKRRRPSQDATSILSSGDERSSSDAFASSSHMVPHTTHSSASRPSAAKLTMHLFGGRKQAQGHIDPNQPPPLPPKSPTMRTPPSLQIPANTANKPPTNGGGARPRSSVMVTSPSINAALEFMREDEERQLAADERREYPPSHDLVQNKEDWRKSDSTVASGHTVRPSQPPEPAQGPNSKRRSTLLTPQNIAGDAALGLDLTGAQATGADAATDRSAMQAKRRSLSLNIHVAPRQPSAPASSGAAIPTYTYTPPPSSLRVPVSSMAEPHHARSPSPDPGSSRGTHSTSHSVSLSPASHDIPTLSHTAANGIIGSGTASGSPVNRTNIRGRLAAWTATSASRGRSPSPLGVLSTSTPSLSSPSVTSLSKAPHRRVPVTSTPSQPPPDLQAIAAVREMQSRTRTPSTSSPGAAGIRQAATLASGASAMAFGFGKRAYEKVGRVWAGAGSGSGSDTPNTQYSNTGIASSGDEAMHPPQHHAPSSFPTHGRRTQNAPSGTWSVSSLSGGSRSSSERDPAGGRDTPPSGPGRMMRRPRSAGAGAVFGRQLWECVRETRAAVRPEHPLAGRMIPALVLRCAEHLHKWGIQEEGLFRISGRSSHINRLRHEFDSGADYDIIDCSPSELDPHAVASLFKAYLRELPEPILTRALGPLFDTAMNAESSRVTPTTPTSFMQKTIASSGSGLPSGPRAIPMIRKPPSLSTFTLPTSTSLRAPSASLIEALGDLVARLPRENRDLLMTVVDLMRATAAESKETKMPLSNLLLVFCPSLSMSPTLLRVLCDSSGVWERAQEPPVIEVAKSPVVVQDEGEDSDETDSDSDSVSSYGEEAQVVALPTMYKSVEAEVETQGEETQLEVANREATSSEDNEPLPRAESPVSMPLVRPQVVRRVPVPGLVLAEGPSQWRAPYSNRSFTPPPQAVPLPLSTSPSVASAPVSASSSTPSLHVPSRSMTPMSAVSLTSAPALESNSMALPPLRSRQFSSPLPSSGYVAPLSWGAPDQNKDLPASPRTPAHFEIEERASSTPPLTIATEALPVRTSSRPLPLIPPSRSAPSVVFPTAKTPTTPTSLKKHALSFSISRQGTVSSDDERPSPSPSPSPSKRPVRRPSLNMLFNMKRSGSPSPRSRTPTISSPLSISAPLLQTPTVDSSPMMVTNALPPVLSLPLDSGPDVGLGLGWDDVFGVNVAEAAFATPPQPRPTAISQPSSQAPWLDPPPSPGRRPTTEFLLSSGGFFSANGPPLALPSPTSVLEAASLSTNVQTAFTRDGDADAVVLQEDSSSGTDSPEVDSPVKDVFTPPPHLSFQLRRSSMEEEDWASAVLMAAGKPQSISHE